TKAQPLEQINEAIQTAASTSRMTQNNASKSFAEALKGNLPKQRPSAILLYPKEKDSFEGPLREFLSEEVPSTHSIFKNVRKLKNIKNNGIAVIVNNKLQQQEFLEELQNIHSIKTKVSPILPAVKHPSAILYNIPNNVNEEEIQKELKTVTHQESNLKVRFKFKGRDENSTNWVFETPENKIEGLPSYWRSWLSKNNKAGTIALPTCNSPIFLFSSNEILAIKIQANSNPLTIISSYSSPYSAIEHNRNETTHLIHSLEEDFLLGADLNAHSQSWGYANTDTRGEKVSDFISSFNGHILNTKDAPPTFEQRDSKGQIFQSFLLWCRLF
ncbi:hypothetical protein AVEN_3889-1, partial [Araneus ventricosus]